jgi:hypothetical protein
MTIFLLSIWTLSYLIKVDSERHRNLLFETREFSVTISNLPRLSQEYTLEQMKYELWEHIQNQISKEPQKIEKLTNSPFSCEIIDIQFAMSDYKNL